MKSPMTLLLKDYGLDSLGGLLIVLREAVFLTYDLALRTAILLNQGKLGQCVYPFLDFEVNVVDLEAEANPERKAYEMSLTVCEKFD